ncbi:MAG: adenylate/guanylate cyclase domain-containing protein, partial [Candidatus Eremiobacterota bacterium]
QGDAQMVVFGLMPASRENHAAAACKAGAGLIYLLEKKRKEWLAQGRPMPETGVGICTGPVSFGVLGTQAHKQYVAIGDPTNTASRMQGKSKELDAPVLITESTYTLAREDSTLALRFLEEIEVKGKREPLKVYEVCVDEVAEQLGYSDPKPPEPLAAASAKQEQA